MCLPILGGLVKLEIAARIEKRRTSTLPEIEWSRTGEADTECPLVG